MRILIIGDNPDFFGGVTNYTRPLAEELSKSNEVHYLFNSTRTGNDTFFKKDGIIEVVKKKYEFKCYELINGSALYKNYKNLEYDYSEWFDDIFEKFLLSIKPDVVHINEIFGFSSSIISIIKKNSIKIIVTVHEYWWLCAHRVMVDYNKKICDGPNDIMKCSFCVSKKIPQKSHGVERNIIKIKHDFPKIFQYAQNFKLLFKNNESTAINEDNLDFNNEPVGIVKDPHLEIKLNTRLKKNIEALNDCDIIIGVSNDVANILTNYGVSEDKILVQHIGSTVAGMNILHTKFMNPNEIVFGFVGGVTYYKGVHQLVEAFTLLPKELKNRAKLNIYGKYQENYFRAIDKQYLQLEEDKSKVTFFGRFTPSDIPQITNEVDINVLPSLCADTAPQTIFESFSNGLSIIAPNVGGFPDFVADGVNGLIYDKASVKDLSKCLQKIMENPELILEFNKNLPQCKTMQQNAKELLDIYMTN